MAERIWWRKPRLRTDDPGDEPRKVTWLELFFDLVFVLAIARVAHELAHHPDLHGLIQYVVLFVPLFWVWAASTYYIEYWETDDISIRVIMFVQMLPIVGLAVFVHEAVKGDVLGYVLCFAAARIILVGLLLRVAYHDKVSRPFALGYAAGFLVVGGLVVSSAFVPAGARQTLWWVAIAIEVATPIVVTLGMGRALPHRRETSKLSERFGLLTIIVLGETVVAVFAALDDTKTFTFGKAVVGVLGLAIATQIWSIYFDFVGRREAREGIWWEFAWGYLHLLLVMAIVAIGACLLHVVASADTTLDPAVQWLLVGASAAVLIALGLMEITIVRGELARTEVAWGIALKFLVALVILSLGFVELLGARRLLLIEVGLLAVPIVFGVRLWIRHATQPSG